MARTDDLRDTGLAVLVIRYFKGWTQADLSRESGVDQGLISEYEQGKRKPGRKTRGRLAKAVGADLEFFEQLVSQCRGIRQLFERIGRPPRTGGPREDEAAPDLAGKIVEAFREGMAPFLLPLSLPDRGPAARAEEDRAWAEERWPLMEPLSAEDQSDFVAVLEGDERSWALAERLCRASEAAAAEQPDEALRLARLAVRLAEGSPGSETWRSRLCGWCERFLAHAAGDSASGTGDRQRAGLKAPFLP